MKHYSRISLYSQPQSTLELSNRISEHLSSNTPTLELSNQISKHLSSNQFRSRKNPMKKG